MEKETIDISVIIPIESSKHLDFSMYLERCITSLINQSITPNEVVIVHSGEETLKTILEGYDYSGLTVNLIHNKGKFDFSSQINLGVQNAKSKYVSFLEFDDEYANIWFKNVKNYIEAYPDHEGFLPLVVDVDEKGAFAGFTNEATFAASMNNEIGYLTNELLINYQNFQTSGMVIKKETFQDFGGFKSSMKLTFVYEFLLRMTYNSAKLMTIPKIGYKHINLRTGSIFWNYKNGEQKITPNEVSFWIESAKKEYFFTEDRNINYQETID
jgi:glycosyltransferase involved in cell wall biosynthesis